MGLLVMWSRVSNILSCVIVKKFMIAYIQYIYDFTRLEEWRKIIVLHEIQ